MHLKRLELLQYDYWLFASKNNLKTTDSFDCTWPCQETINTNDNEGDTSVHCMVMFISVFDIHSFQ